MSTTTTETLTLADYHAAFADALCTVRTLRMHDPFGRLADAEGYLNRLIDRYPTTRTEATC